MLKSARKIICALLALLLVVSGQAAVSAQEMPPGEQMSMTSESMADCGNAGSHPGAAQHGDHAGTRFSSPGCSDTDNMACLSSAGSASCVLTVVLAHNTGLTSLDARSCPLTPGRLFAYRNPFLEVITPPPDFLS